MSDEGKPNPMDDLKEGLGLLFRAAKGAVEKLPTDKVEGVAKEAAKEVGRAFETLGNEIDKVWNKAVDKQPKPDEEPKKDAPPAEPGTNQPFDDAYGPEPHDPKGPRVG